MAEILITEQNNENMPITVTVPTTLLVPLLRVASSRIICHAHVVLMIYGYVQLTVQVCLKLPRQTRLEVSNEFNWLFTL
jgi:hypothetical protein